MLLKGLLALVVFVFSASAAVAQGSSTGELPPTDPRVELANRFMQATHKEDYIHRIYRTQLLQSMNFCYDDPCQAALEKTVDVAAKHAARLYVAEMAKLLAGRLSEPQLSAWVQFSESSDGQAVVAAEDTMTDDMARLGHQMSVESREEVSRNFCPEHPNVCVAGSPQHDQRR